MDTIGESVLIGNKFKFYDELITIPNNFNLNYNLWKLCFEKGLQRVMK